jgi:phage shock protein A
MNSLKRIFVSIKGQIDHVADEFENHEALAGVAIKDLQAIASKTRLHLHRISKMSEHYQSQLQEQQEQAGLWTERAVKAKQEDEQKALQCVKRLRQTQKQIKVLEQQCQETETQELKIRNDLNAIQEQLQMLKNKKEILAARQNRAGIQEVLMDSQGNSLQDVQNIFERWEGSVVSAEFETPEQIDNDSFASEFEQEEDELELKAMLNELTETEKSSENN